MRCIRTRIRWDERSSLDAHLFLYESDFFFGSEKGMDHKYLISNKKETHTLFYKSSVHDTEYLLNVIKIHKKPEDRAQGEKPFKVIWRVITILSSETNQSSPLIGKINAEPQFNNSNPR